LGHPLRRGFVFVEGLALLDARSRVFRRRLPALSQLFDEGGHCELVNASDVAIRDLMLEQISSFL
jgi:hypothetical protein